MYRECRGSFEINELVHGGTTVHINKSENLQRLPSTSVDRSMMNEEYFYVRVMGKPADLCAETIVEYELSRSRTRRVVVPPATLLAQAPESVRVGETGDFSFVVDLNCCAGVSEDFTIEVFPTDQTAFLGVFSDLLTYSCGTPRPFNVAGRLVGERGNVVVAIKGRNIECRMNTHIHRGE
jgi:hypothetical protein